MRILSNAMSEQATSSKSKRAKPEKQIAGISTGGRKIIKKGPPSKSMSASDIRAKIEKMKMKKEVKSAEVKGNSFSTAMPGTKEIEAEKKAAKKAEKSLETNNDTEKNAVKAEEKKEGQAKLVDASGSPIQSDVGKNDPTDTNVHEKLKDILQTGAFSFNEKERKALSSILNKDA